MNVLIRADGSTHTGGGHVGRCIALAEAIGAAGGNVRFATRADAPLGQAMLKAARLPFSLLDSADDWKADAGATRDLAAGADWIAVDHYGLDCRWEEIVKSAGARLLVLDDLANRPHACDLLADPGRGADGGAAYADLVPDGCVTLFGPRHALLRQEFVVRRRAGKTFRDRPRVAIFFGSADGARLTEPALEAVAGAVPAGSVETHVIVTSANERRAALRARPGISVHEDVTDMAGLLDSMDIAIGAGGIALWERCCLGLPGLAVALNDNQRPGVRAAADAGAIRSLAPAAAREPEALAAAVRKLFDERDRWPDMSARGRRLVDGRGAARLVAHMGPLSLQPAGTADCETLWRWANDPAVRQMAFESAQIPREDHDAWFARKLESASTIILIARHGVAPVGQVRFDKAAGEGGWLVDISVAAAHRGRRLALEMLLKALVALRRDCPDALAVAWVKDQNRPSRALFEAAGFAPDGARPGATRFVYN